MRLYNILLTAVLISQMSFCNGSTIEFKNNRATKSDLDVSCIGPTNADNFVIYLHGMDSVMPSQQELHNRDILNNIAKILNIRFAIPRAQAQCPKQPNSICWGWKFDQIELSTVLPQVMEARLKCFSNEKSFGMLGFSNGGYLLMRWYSEGSSPSILPRLNLIVASGSGKGQVSSVISDLSTNPKLVLVIGKQDQFNYDPSESWFQSLQRLKAQVQLIEFEGGHELNQDALLKALGKLSLSIKN